MNKKTKIILGMLMSMLIVTSLSMNVLADVGNSFSGGGGSSSGGFSFGGGGGLFVFGGSPMVMIIIVVIYLILRAYGQNKGGNSSNQQYQQPSSMMDETTVVSSIQAADPDFSAEKFKAFVAEVYITLQEAWEKKDWTGVRPFESDTLFNMHNRQLQEYIDQKKTPHLDMQNVQDVKLAEYHVDGQSEVLVVRLHASLIDYTTDDETGKILEGNKTTMQNRYYRLEFIRANGVKTDVNKDLKTTNCPNCGAPTKVTSSGQCEYCGSVITNGKYGWVLNVYAAWH